MRVAYGWKPDSDWGTSPLWQANLSEGQSLKNASYHYLISDHLGTPQLAINSAGEQSWKINSDEFDNSELDANNQITMNLRFPGQYYDAETGLSYNYFRDYDAKTGRYIQSDPIGLAGGINIFVYSEENPVKIYDNYGLSTCHEGYCQQQFIDCMANCIRTLDPLSDNYLDKFDLYAKGLFTSMGGTIGKKWVGLRIGLKGASRATTLPSILSHNLGGRKTWIGDKLRNTGRFFSPYWIGYGWYLFGVEIGCSISCSLDKCSYTK